MTKPIGNPNAKIMIIGEAPGENEEEWKTPFVGASGRLLAQLLSAQGFPVPRPSSYAQPEEMVWVWENSDVYLTNVVRRRPPSNDIDRFFSKKGEAKKQGIQEVMGRYPHAEILEGIEELESEILGVDPNVILALGNTPLWALTGHMGVTSWRGSQMESREIGGKNFEVVPSIHPALVLRQYPWKVLLEHDMKDRVLPDSEFQGAPKPDYNFIFAPRFEEAKEILEWILSELEKGPMKLASDIETRWSQIACEGLAWSNKDAICIPILTQQAPYSYWDLEEETYLVDLIKKIHTHPNARIVGQNFNYDREYFAKLWGFLSNLYMDTMTAHHICWPSLKKSLEFLSSLYCSYHHYWKDESSEWDPKLGEQQLWIYNCKDVVVTYEVSDELETLVPQMGFQEQYDFQMRMEDLVIHSWLRGVRYDDKKRNEIGTKLIQEIQRYRDWFIWLLGEERLNPKSKAYWFDSDQQLKLLFQDQLRIKLPKNKDGNPSTGKDAMPIIKKREPIVAPLCDALLEYRSLQVYYNTFIKVPLDPSDGRFRAELDVNGTYTFRCSSRSDAFNVGTNMQNIPAGKEDD